MRKWLVGLFCIFVSFAVQAVPFTQIYYSEETLTAEEIKNLELIYGANLYIIKYNSPPPEKPVKVKGVVLHSDPEDAKWIVGDFNPLLNGLKRLNQFSNDRLIEERFLRQYSTLAPVSASLKSILAGETFDGMTAAQRLEAIRKKIIEHFGTDAIIKVRDGFGSDGRLPRTTERWDILYQNYLRYTKPRVRKLDKIYSNEIEAQDHANRFNYIEGRYLEEVLFAQENVYAQKLISPFEYEIRIHVVPQIFSNGKMQAVILAGGTVSRFDRFGKYIPEEILLAAENAIRDNFLKNLSLDDSSRYSASMDVVKSGDNYFIVDQNFGLQSGMYYAENDIMIANLIAEHFSNTETEYLKDFRRFATSPLEEKPFLVRQMIQKYGDFVRRHGSSGFWDRMMLEFVNEFKKSPTVLNAIAIRKLMIKSGIKDQWILAEYDARVNDLLPCDQLLQFSVTPAS